jgi:hypothetical protein
MDYKDIVKIVDIFNFIYIYIVYIIFFPICYIPFALYYRIKNINTTYSETITNKIIKHLNSNIIYLNKNKIIDNGFILANHRCSFDFIFDPHISKSSIIGRYKAVLSTFFLSILGIIENRIISMEKKFGRDYIFAITKKHMNKQSFNEYNKRITFYPEGSRLNHTKIENFENCIKPGLLKSIYEYNKISLQIIMTKNKEKVYNEFNIDVNYNVNLPIYISNEIKPSEFNTFDGFYEFVCKEWYKIFNELYKDI